MKESREYFAKVAKNWDTMREGFFTVAMRDAAIASIALKPTDIVADIGTGTGFMIQGLAAHVKTVHGFDESSHMLDVARKNLDGFRNIRLHQTDGKTLPIPDHSFHAVFANMYLHHTPDPQTAISEMVRVLKPGGHLLITDLDKHDQNWMKEEMADFWLGFERDTLGRWMAEAGLEVIGIECAQGRCCTKNLTGDVQSLDIFLAIGIRRQH